jgi:nanoRNase/pAp phosphatase (c-di-AMP/oligoRNAs hydrolase)
MVVNGTCFSSELGNSICLEAEQAPDVLAVIYSIQDDWSVRCSIRSIDGGKVNARRFAERYDGGGHNNAAGCRFDDFTAFTAALETLRKEGWGPAGE